MKAEGLDDLLLKYEDGSAGVDQRGTLFGGIVAEPMFEMAIGFVANFTMGLIGAVIAVWPKPYDPDFMRPEIFRSSKGALMALPVSLAGIAMLYWGWIRPWL